MRFWIQVAAGLVVLWLLAFSAIGIVRSNRPSPERMIACLQQNPVAQLSAEKRSEVMQRVIRELNRMDFEQRRTLQRNQELREFFAALSPEEKNEFLEATLPEGFRQLMQAFNEMTPERRRSLVERALEDIERAEKERASGSLPPEADFAMLQKIVDEGLQAFYSEASAETKLDLAPVIERVQESLQTMR